MNQREPYDLKINALTVNGIRLKKNIPRLSISTQLKAFKAIYGSQKQRLSILISPGYPLTLRGFCGANASRSIKRKSSKKTGLLQKADLTTPLNAQANCENWHTMAALGVKSPKAPLVQDLESFTY
ncbi:hypothetical protein [Vampirovibrio chlorellavorus]|uniref:hypothetical protein n=1 Tax=Vampirovibrio chlorellavorus TaxID=758823 RepID=UPI0026EFCFB5|nr:hypothetical protein [Vampirovibrio chlorellavorus]